MSALLEAISCTELILCTSVTLLKTRYTVQAMLLCVALRDLQLLCSGVKHSACMDQRMFRVQGSRLTLSVFLLFSRFPVFFPLLPACSVYQLSSTSLSHSLSLSFSLSLSLTVSVSRFLYLPYVVPFIFQSRNKSCTYIVLNPDSPNKVNTIHMYC